MVAGDLVFFHGKGIVSWLIRKVSHGNYNHCAMALSDTLVLESEWNSGTRIRNIEAYKKEGAEITVVPMDITKEQKKKLYKMCNSNLSAKFYDWKQIAKLFMKYVFHITINKKNTRDKVICSELVSILLLDLGITDDISIIEFSPQELYTYSINVLNNVK